jgi:hypothetical protein
MAEKIVSPGVFTRENDQSFLSQGIGEIGAAIIGPFEKGPAFVPTIVNTQSEFESIFGVPNGQYYTGYTVQNYLREAGTVTIVRVGHIGGYTNEVSSSYGIKVVGAGVDKIVGVIKPTHNWSTSGNGDAYSASLSSQVSSSQFSITLNGPETEWDVTNLSASILPSAGNDLSDVFGESSRGSRGVYVSQYFENEATSLSNSIQNGAQIQLVNLLEQSFDGQDVKEASTPWIVSQKISGTRYNLFRFHTLGDGSNYNKEYKVSIFNVKAAGESNATDYSTFSVTIRGYSDTDRKKSVLETYNNLNLDPASPNYILKVIGDQNVSIDANGKQTLNGDYSNRSKFVRVEVAAEGSFPIIAGPFGHEAYLSPISGFNTSTPSVKFSTGSAENNSSNSSKYSGIDLESSLVKVDNGHFLSPIPNGAGNGTNTVFAFDQSNLSINGGTYSFGYELTGSSASDVVKRQFTVGFQEGFDGCSPTIEIALAGSSESFGSANTQGFNCATSTSSGSVAYVKAINSVSNPDDFDINLVSVPGIVRRHHSYVFDKVTEMVESREDAFFIGDVVGVTYTNGQVSSDTIEQAIEQANSVDSNYVGTYYPWVKTIDRNTNKLTAVPPSVLMPGIYAANDAIAAEWFAPAGLNRGGIIGAVSVLNRLTHAERDELYEGKVNPIASFPGEGIVAFGQKTLQDKSSALDRINVRRLLIKVKKYIASTSRYLVFEQNTATTRSRFLNTVNPYLEGIQQRQGLYAFKVVMDETNNTPDVIDRNILAGQIFLQPTKTAEFIVLDFNILPTGASFSA